MVRPALLIEQQIPIDESGSTCVQAAYDGMRILLGLAFLRCLAILAARVFHAALGEQQLLVGPASRNFVHLLEMIARIPMKRHARKSIGGDRTLSSPASGGKRKLPRLIHRRPEGGLNTRQYLVGVVVPSEQLHIAMPRRIQRRTQIRCRELSFLFRAEQARIPRLACHGLVLHAHAADAHALASIRVHVFRQHFGPYLILRTTQLAAPVHAAVGLHERRRAPGACEQLQLRVHRKPALDEREQQLPVATDGKRPQAGIEGPDIRVIAQREIAALDVRTAQAIRISAGDRIAILRSPEAQQQKAVLQLRRHEGEHVRRCLRERTAEPRYTLICHIGTAGDQMEFGIRIARESQLIPG